MISLAIALLILRLDFLMLLAPWALRCVDGKEYKPHLVVAALIAWPLDIFLAHTAWARLYGWPQWGEWTISHTLERLCHHDNYDHPDYLLLVQIGLRINRIAPGHIKILT